MPSHPQHRYRLFGLSISSEIELPEAQADPEREAEVDLRVRFGKIDLPDSPAGLNVVGDRLLLTIPGVARYRVDDGSNILIDPVSGVPEKNLRLYLLGSAMGAALHQRGLLPLHANAIEIDDVAVAFIGESGAGKSTLAAWFHDQGHRVLTDDVCVIHDTAGGQPAVFPAVRRLRLRRDALLASGRDVDAHSASYSGDPEFDKFDVPLPPADDSPVCLSAVILLAFGAEENLEMLEGMKAAEVLFAHTYRGGMVDQIGNAGVHWLAITRLVPTVRVLRWTRPREWASFETHARSLVTALRVSLTGKPDQASVGQIV